MDLSAALEDFLAKVRAEHARAVAKFPSPECSVVALSEEVGELSKAMLDESSERVVKEAVQVAVMAAKVATQGDPTLDAYRAKSGAGPHPLVARPSPSAEHAPAVKAEPALRPGSECSGSELIFSSVVVTPELHVEVGVKCRVCKWHTKISVPVESPFRSHDAHWVFEQLADAHCCEHRGWVLRPVAEQIAVALQLQRSVTVGDLVLPQLGLGLRAPDADCTICHGMKGKHVGGLQGWAPCICQYPKPKPPPGSLGPVDEPSASPPRDAKEPRHE